MTTADVLLFAFRGATCLLCLSSQPFLESLPVGYVVHKERWLLCGNKVFTSMLTRSDGRSGTQ